MVPAIRSQGPQFRGLERRSNAKCALHAGLDVPRHSAISYDMQLIAGVTVLVGQLRIWLHAQRQHHRACLDELLLAVGVGVGYTVGGNRGAAGLRNALAALVILPGVVPHG